MRRRTAVPAALLAAAVCGSVVPVSSAQAAGLDGSARFTDSFDDTPCGVSVHVVIQADNPFVTTGKITEIGDPVTVDTGHLLQRFTTPDGRWTEDDFSGPAKVITAVANPDGTVSKRVVFDGTKRIFTAWNGDVVADRGVLVVDYLIGFDDNGDGYVISRTLVRQVGDFPIASGQVDFCDFLTAHLG